MSITHILLTIECQILKIRRPCVYMLIDALVRLYIDVLCHRGRWHRGIGGVLVRQCCGRSQRIRRQSPSANYNSHRRQRAWYNDHQQTQRICTCTTVQRGQLQCLQPPHTIWSSVLAVTPSGAGRRHSAAKQPGMWCVRDLLLSHSHWYHTLHLSLCVPSWLIIVVCTPQSASHVGFSSLRLEPTLMILGQAAVSCTRVTDLY